MEGVATKILGQDSLKMLWKQFISKEWYEIFKLEFMLMVGTQSVYED